MAGRAGPATFHKTTAPLSLALASRCPSGENDSAAMPPAWRVRVAMRATRAGSAVFHKATVPPSLALASRCPPGENDSAAMRPALAGEGGDAGDAGRVGGVPQGHRAVVVATGQGAPVRGERDRTYPGGASRQDRDLGGPARVVGHVPQDHGLAAGGGQDAPVRRERRICPGDDVTPGVAEPLGAAQVRGIPYLQVGVDRGHGAPVRRERHPERSGLAQRRRRPVIAQIVLPDHDAREQDEHHEARDNETGGGKAFLCRRIMGSLSVR